MNMIALRPWDRSRRNETAFRTVPIDILPGNSLKSGIQPEWNESMAAVSKARSLVKSCAPLLSFVKRTQARSDDDRLSTMACAICFALLTM